MSEAEQAEKGKGGINVERVIRSKDQLLDKDLAKMVETGVVS